VTVTVTTAPVAPGAGTRTGTITVSDQAAPSVFCTITLPATSCALTPNATGNRTLVASYSGDANFNGTQAPLPSVVHNVSSGGLVNTTTVVTVVNPAAPVYRQPVAGPHAVAPACRPRRPTPRSAHLRVRLPAHPP